MDETSNDEHRKEIHTTHAATQESCENEGDCNQSDKCAQTPLLASTSAEQPCRSDDTDSQYIKSSSTLSCPTNQLHPFSSQVWSGRHQFKAPHISYDMTPFSSTNSSLTPICRICQCPGDQNNVLINPCRCDGTLRYIHGTCLRKWIEVSMRKAKTVGPAHCELCGFIYRKHKYVKCKNWQCPKVNVRDKTLHSIFLISLAIMVGSAIATVMCFITDREQLAKYKSSQQARTYLTKEEVITLSCGIAFFVSFFVAMSVEIKAKHTIYQIFRRCIRYNTVWIIENYSPDADDQYDTRPHRDP